MINEATIPESTKILPDGEERAKEGSEQATSTIEKEKNIADEERVSEIEDRLKFRPLRLHSSKIVRIDRPNAFGHDLGNWLINCETIPDSFFDGYLDFLDVPAVIPLVRKHELEVTPLNEFEEVTTQQPSSEASSPSDTSQLRALGFHSHAYVGLPKPVFVKHSISLFPTGSKATIIPPSWIPKAKLPPFSEQGEVEATTQEVQVEIKEEAATTTSDPYLRDGDVITKTRHEGKTLEEGEAIGQHVPTSMSKKDEGQCFATPWWLFIKIKRSKNDHEGV